MGLIKDVSLKSSNYRKHQYVKKYFDGEAYKRALEIKDESNSWYEWFDGKNWNLSTGIDAAISCADYQRFMSKKFIKKD